MVQLICTNPAKASVIGINRKRLEYLRRMVMYDNSRLRSLELSTIGEMNRLTDNCISYRSTRPHRVAIQERELGLVRVTPFVDSNPAESRIAGIRYVRELSDTMEGEKPTIMEMYSAYHRYVGNIIKGLEENPERYKQGVPRASLSFAKNLGEKLSKRLERALK